MTDLVLYGVAVQEDEFADERVIASSYDRAENVAGAGRCR
ncbi:hypothetical protein GCM10017667_52850 [Streptomyces filamentosus]|uniref:Uncharacterized protein n=1 Tax=Streptomyces filamentosus TaxID=67294 RepID=A0A919BSY4_STRFL|nr:hypothetical protein GCM10017667_52850 [Streptomyces filamentosus]